MKIAPIPEFVVTLAGVQRDKPLAGDPNFPADLPCNIVRFVRNLKDAPPGVQDKGGEAAMLQIGYAGHDLAISQATAIELILEHYNPRCEPPWEFDELTSKIENSYKYPQNGFGCRAVLPLEQRIPNLDKLIEDSAPAAVAPKNKSRFVLIPASEWAALEAPTFLIEDFIPDKSSVLFYGPLSSYKSFLALTIAGSIASGVPAFGKFKVNRTGHVVLAVGEQPNATGKVRFPAWALDCKQTLANLPLTLVPTVPLLGDLPDIEDFVAALKPLKPVLVVIDTLSKAMAGLDFNNPKDGIVAGERIRQIVEALDCVVLVIGHSGKDIKRGLLGSNLVSANIDAIYVVERPVEKGPAVIVRNIRLRNSDERSDLHFRADKLLNSAVMRLTTLSEFKSLTGAVGKRNALVAEIEGTLRAHGYIGTNTCSYSELLILILTDRGELENDPEIDKPAKRSLRKKIDKLREEDDETVLALGRKAKGKTAGLQWSAPALSDDDETEGDLGSLEDAQ